MSDSILRDLALYSLQLAVVLGVGALLPGLLRIRSPYLCLGYWYVLLVLALAVPFAAFLGNAALPLETGVVAIWLDEIVTVAASTPGGSAAGGWLLAVLILGSSARLFWVALGARALNRIRRDGCELSPPTRVVELLADPLVQKARFFVSSEISTPTMFGGLRPTVLVPEAFNHLSSSEQEAVLCHELVHVKRRDWFAVLAEEGLRIVFWFHPLVWVVLRKISLSREEVVDREVVRVLASRRGYRGRGLPDSEEGGRGHGRPHSGRARRDSGGQDPWPPDCGRDHALQVVGSSGRGSGRGYLRVQRGEVSGSGNRGRAGRHAFLAKIHRERGEDCCKPRQASRAKSARAKAEVREQRGIERYLFRDGRIALKDVYRKPLEPGVSE